MNQIVEATQADELSTIATDTGSLILDVGSMNSIMKMAEFMAKGRSTIPNHLQGNSADCAAVVMQAVQWKMNPYAVAQKTHIVNGTLGYEAQLVNAVIQSSGVTLDRFNYEWYGEWEKIIGKSKVKTSPAKGNFGEKDYKKETQYRLPDYDLNDEVGLGVRIWATLKGEDGPRVLDLLLVQASVRNSPLWATDPRQQLAYLAVKRWTRLYAPDVILGVYTPDELEEIRPPQTRTMGQAEIVHEDPPPELLVLAEDAAKKGCSAYEQFFKVTGYANRKLLAGEHERLKAMATKADSDRTFDAQPTEQGKAAQAKPSIDLENLYADLYAITEEGIDAFDNAWNCLSEEAQDALSDKLVALTTRAKTFGGAK